MGFTAGLNIVAQFGEELFALIGTAQVTAKPWGRKFRPGVCVFKTQCTMTQPVLKVETR